MWQLSTSMTMKAIILVLLLTLPTTLVSSSCTLTLTKEVFPRVMALAGEFTLTLSSPEVTLFGADV